jgi:hypothetical protein
MIHLTPFLHIPLGVALDRVAVVNPSAVLKKSVLAIHACAHSATLVVAGVVFLACVVGKTVLVDPSIKTIIGAALTTPRLEILVLHAAIEDDLAC